jgi:hypothetical protein
VRPGAGEWRAGQPSRTPDGSLCFHCQRPRFTKLNVRHPSAFTWATRPRLTRHLWRMCFALFIAAGSFFSVRTRVAKVLPEPFTTAPMRALPILLLFGRCSIGCGGSAAAVRYQCSSDTIPCHSLLARSESTERVLSKLVGAG